MYPSADLRNSLSAFYDGLRIPNVAGSDFGINAVFVVDKGHDLTGLICTEEMYKSKYRSNRREGIFTHGFYCRRRASQSGSTGGKGVVKGSIFAISTREPNSDRTDDLTEGIIHNMYALTLHELGHNLGLEHGGDEDLNCKPNYPSLMNYAYDYRFNAFGGQFLESTQLQYSPGEVREIDEEQLTEVDPLGARWGAVDFLKYFGSGILLEESANGNTDVDWNGTGVIASQDYTYALNVRINGSGDKACTEKNSSPRKLRDLSDLERIVNMMPGRESADSSSAESEAEEGEGRIPPDYGEPRKSSDLVRKDVFVNKERLANHVGRGGKALEKWLANAGLDPISDRELLVKLESLVPPGDGARQLLAATTLPGDLRWVSQSNREQEVKTRAEEFLAASLGRPVRVSFKDCKLEAEVVAEVVRNARRPGPAVSKASSSSVASSLQGVRDVSLCR